MSNRTTKTKGKGGHYAKSEQSGPSTPDAPPEQQLTWTALRVLELAAAPPKTETGADGQPTYKPRMSNREIAAAAGCSAQYVQQLKKDPRWLQAYYGLIARRLQAYLPELIDKAMESARLLGRDGHHDRRMLLNMAGVATAGVQEHQHEHKHTASDRLQRALERSRQRGGATAETIDATPIEPESGEVVQGADEPAEGRSQDAIDADPLGED
jgi:hypothetical protein